MDARLSPRLPIFACAGLILFLFLANLWNFAVERDWPKLRIRSAQPLAGVSRPAPAPWSWDAFLSGETQRAVSSNLGQGSPMFPISVRAKNQFLYALFKTSGVANIVVGKGEQLFETSYIDEFCRRGAPPDPSVLGEWANAVAQIRDAVAAREKSFAYLVSPSKPAYEPGWLPPERPCAALRQGRDTEKLRPYAAALAARGVPYVEAQSLMRRARAEYPIEMFPRGGTHWNLLGAALALREITQAFAAQPTGSPLGAFDVDWREADVAGGTDRDLLDLLNLVWPPDHYPTAAVFRRGPAGACDKPPRLLLVGDSFLRELVVVAAQARCPPIVDHWFYMRSENGDVTLTRYLTQPGEIGNGERLGTDLSLLPESFAQADAVLLQENAINLTKTRQVRELLEAVRGR